MIDLSTTNLFLWMIGVMLLGILAVISFQTDRIVSQLILLITNSEELKRIANALEKLTKGGKS